MMQRILTWFFEKIKALRVATQKKERERKAEIENLTVREEREETKNNKTKRIVDFLFPLLKFLVPISRSVVIARCTI